MPNKTLKDYFKLNDRYMEYQTKHFVTIGKLIQINEQIKSLLIKRDELEKVEKVLKEKCKSEPMFMGDKTDKA
jgi:hypothetical protein|tara:strand:- start:125 stop:343 length:219 start_codon:yes stop_codon:yes gene_type:complete